MPGNGKVFVSHTHVDNALCDPLLAALRAWGVDYWFDTQQMSAGSQLAGPIQQAIEERDAFLRICTPAAQSSFWMTLERDAFLALLARDRQSGRPDQRHLIPIRLDAAYHFEPFELGILHIDAVGKSQRAWLDELRVALGLDVNSARGAPPVRVASPSTPATHAPVRVAGPATGTLAAAAPMRAPILVPRLSPAPTHVVDASGAGQYRTIGEAIAAAQPGDRVQIRPGTYREFVRLDTSLDLIGEGPREHIIIEWQEDYDKCAISMETSRALLANLTIRRLGAWTISHRSYYDTKIESGPGSAIACGTGQLEVYGCDLSSTGGDGIAVSGDAELVLTFCRIANCKQSGVSVAGKQGRATLEDNDIVSNYGDGLLLARDTIAIARRNRITGNAGYGIAFDGRASGTFEDNDLRNNGKGAWHLSGVTSLFGFGKVSGITRARNQE